MRVFSWEPPPIERLHPFLSHATKLGNIALNYHSHKNQEEEKYMSWKEWLPADFDPEF
jgi:hypothetical protein